MDEKLSSSTPEEEPTGKEIIKIALLGEGLLCGVSLLWFLLDPEIACQGWDAYSALIGAVAALPLLGASFAISIMAEEIPALRKSLFGKRLAEFQRTFIWPLCQALNWKQAALVGIASGLGEELFFRGLSTSILLLVASLPLALLLVNVFFAVIHFVGKIGYFAPILPIYIGAGLYFSLLMLWSHSLLAAVVAHALFNFISIHLNRRMAEKSMQSGNCDF